MSALSWILIAIVLILVIFLAVIFFSKKKKCPPDYKSWFVMGITWAIVGIPFAISFNNYGLLGIGIIFTILGLAHKKDWNKYKKPSWKDLTKKEKQLRIWIMIVLRILVLGLIAYALFRIYP